MNWSLVTTSAWLSAAPPGGTLTPGGGSGIVNITIGTSATNFPLGGYSSTLLFSNQTSGVAQARAVSLYERALGRDPALQAAAVNLGRLYAEGGRLGEAIRLWEGALRRNPALEEARINLGVAHARSGERLRARAEAERALEINPDSARARALLEAVKQP